MKLRFDRKSWLLLMAVNIFVIIVQLMVVIFAGSWNTRDLMRAFYVSLIYANVSALPGLLILPGVLERLAPRKSLQFSAIVLGTLFFLLAGCLVAQILLWQADVFTPVFWRFYLRIVPPSILGSILFCAGAFLYGSMQERAHRAEEKLREKEVMEAHAQKLAAEARLESLAARLHPHFLFNALNSISSLIVDNPALAEKMVGRLAALLRASLDNTNQPLIPLRQELAMIRDYIEIEEVRFGSRLTGRIEVPEELQAARVPPLSILSLVENAVKHGIHPQPGGGEFLVAASRFHNRNLLIEVRDSGPGFSLASIPAGHGLDNLVGRLHALYGEKAHISVLQRDGWCIVQMVVPEQ